MFPKCIFFLKGRILQSFFFFWIEKVIDDLFSNVSKKNIPFKFLSFPYDTILNKKNRVRGKKSKVKCLFNVVCRDVNRVPNKPEPQNFWGSLNYIG